MDIERLALIVMVVLACPLVLPVVLDEEDTTAGTENQIVWTSGAGVSARCVTDSAEKRRTDNEPTDLSLERPVWQSNR